MKMFRLNVSNGEGKVVPYYKYITGPMYDTARYPWDVLRLIGVRNVWVSTEARKVWKGYIYIAAEDRI